MIRFIKQKLQQRRFNHNNLKESDITYSSTARCCCGAGLAYVKGCHKIKGADTAWDCSDILMNRAIEKGKEGSQKHSDLYPFAFWDIKSENQYNHSGGKLTTRGNKYPPCSECQSGKIVHYTHFEYMGQLRSAHWDTGVKAVDGKGLKEITL